MCCLEGYYKRGVEVRFLAEGLAHCPHLRGGPGCVMWGFTKIMTMSSASRTTWPRRVLRM